MVDKNGNRTEFGKITTCESRIDSIRDIKFNNELITQAIHRINTINISNK